MLITALSFIIALLFIFYPQMIPNDSLLIPILMFVAGTAILLVFPILSYLNLIPLQRLEQKLIPGLLERFRKDYLISISRFFLYLFPFISYLLGIIWLFPNIPFHSILLAVWVVLFGLTIGLMQNYFRRALSFLEPSYFIQLSTEDARRSIQNGNDDELFKSIDYLTEIGVRSIQEGKLAVGLQTLNAYPSILHIFFNASKSITRVNQDQKIKKETGRDEASYTVFYLLQRLELINSKALENGLGTICSHIIMILGKIIVYSAKFDISMVTFPAHVLGKFALKALQYHFDEVAALATSTLLEVSRTIIDEVDLTYMDIQEPFDTIINNLNFIAQATFKKDKGLHPRMLAQPLQELRDLFQNEKIAQHRDTPVIIQHIDAVLAEFTALEQVMRALPPIPPS